jgi:hypothetical protein
MARHRTRIIATLMLACVASTAPTSGFGQMRTDQLMWQCDADEKSSTGQLEMIFCIGILAGFNDLNAILPALGHRPIFCVPPRGVSNDQLRLIFLKWARDNPSQLHESARMSVVVALAHAFPCK